MKNEELQIAVLIDGDNANAKNIENTLQRISEHGNIIIKRVYGDFSQPCLGVWKECVNKFSIKAMQTFNYTKGKNSTDIALIIDAMDILYNDEVNAICVISTDCDFTGLIHRVKENGLFTIGVGKDNACNSFKTACDLFLIEEKVPKCDIKQLLDSNYLADKTPVAEIIKPQKYQLPGLKVVGKINLKQ